MWPFTNWKAKYERLRLENDMYRERVAQLEARAKSIKDLELIIKCQKMYIEDDAGIIEILDAAKKIDQYKAHLKSQKPDPHSHYMARQQSLSMGMGGMQGLAGQAGACNQGSAFERTTNIY